MELFTTLVSGLHNGSASRFSRVPTQSIILHIDWCFAEEVKLPENSRRPHPRYSPVRKRSIAIAGNRTSVSLEDPFWRALRAIAYAERLDTNVLVAEIAANRPNIGISSAIRQFVLFYSQNHTLAGSMKPHDERAAAVPD